MTKDESDEGAPLDWRLARDAVHLENERPRPADSGQLARIEPRAPFRDMATGTWCTGPESGLVARAWQRLGYPHEWLFRLDSRIYRVQGVFVQPQDMAGTPATPASVLVPTPEIRSRSARRFLARWRPRVHVRLRWPSPAVRLAFLVWLGWECTWIAFSALALAYGAADVEGPTALISHPLAESLSRWTLWDGWYFIQIAQGGYAHANQAAFYPLYPVLIRGALWLAHPFPALPAPLVALAVDHLASLAAVLGLALLAEDDGRRRGLAPLERARLARWTLAALLAYPLAFFLLAAYSDALFLALAVWTLYSARRRRWVLAGALALLAGLARPVAPALALPLVLEYLASRRERGGLARPLHVRWLRRAWQALVTADLIAISCLGMLAFTLYCLLDYGKVNAPALAERANFGRILAGPWTGIGLALSQWRKLPPLSYYQLRWLSDIAPLAACILVTGGLALLAALAWTPARLAFLAHLTRWRAWVQRLDWPSSYTAYLAGAVAIILCTPVTIALFPDAYAGAGRFVMAAFPLFLLGGRIFARYPALGHAAITAALLIQVVLAAYVLRGGWLI